MQLYLHEMPSRDDISRTVSTAYCAQLSLHNIVIRIFHLLRWAKKTATHENATRSYGTVSLDR